MLYSVLWRYEHNIVDIAQIAPHLAGLTEVGTVVLRSRCPFWEGPLKDALSQGMPQIRYGAKGSVRARVHKSRILVKKGKTAVSLNSRQKRSQAKFLFRSARGFVYLTQCGMIEISAIPLQAKGSALTTAKNFP
jgi:hypothetical protein